MASSVKEGCHLGLDRLDLLLAFLLDAHPVGFLQSAVGERRNLLDQRGVPRRRLPVPLGPAACLDQFLDRLDRGLHLLVSVDDGAEHDLLGQLVGFGFHHQHGLRSAGHHQVHLRFLQLRSRRIQDVLAVDVRHARRADRPGEWHAGNRESRGGADHRRNIGIDLRIARQHRQHHLDFVHEAFGEQRTDRPVDQARGQGLLLGGAPFALEEAAWDAPGSIELLEVIDREREERLTRLRLAGRHDGGEHHGVAHGDDDRAAGLAGDLAGFQGDRMLAPLECLLGYFEHVLFSLRLPRGDLAT